MEIPPAPPNADETLATIGHRIYRSFGSLEVASRSHEHEDSFASALLNEFQRFGLWAKNLGLYNLGHSSLDYRFRDAPVVKEYTSHLLIDLEKSISKIQQDLDRRTPGREMAPERLRSLGKVSDQDAERIQEYDEEKGSDESSEDEDELVSYQEESVSTIVLENARLIIDRLYKLSFKIRNPATRLGFSKARSYREIDEETGVDLMDWYATFDLQHVAEVLARYWRRPPEECESHYLVKRLASANTHRRRQFGQWRKHKLKLENVEKVLSNFSLGSERGALSLPSTATRLDEKDFRLSDIASAVSSTTNATSFTGDDENEINIPPLPEKFCSGKEFECPYCYVLCSRRMFQKNEWERHVLRDIRPYVCTYEDCTEADQQYDSIKDWVSHEVNAHRETELQPAKSSEQFSYDGGLSQHFKPATPNDTCRKECPICLKKNPSFVHIGCHLQRIAVSALPRSTGAEDEVGMEENGPEVPKNEYRDSLPSTVSSTSDSEGEVSGGLSTGEGLVSESTPVSAGSLRALDESTEQGVEKATYSTGVDYGNIDMPGRPTKSGYALGTRTTIENKAPIQQSQQQYTSGYQYTYGYQSLRPPTLNTGFPSSSHSMNITNTSSDSGYTTENPSVASPIQQQSYPVQSYPVQQQSANYSYGNQRSPGIEVVRAAPVSSSKNKKERRLSTPSPSSPSEFPCLYPNCGHISSRAHDLKRHMTIHFPPAVDELLDCKYEWCGRTGAHGFKREDHRKEHYKKVHTKESEWPKMGRGGKSDRSSGRSKP